MKKSLFLILLIPLILSFCSQGPSPEQVKEWIKVVDIKTQWVEKIGPDVRPWEVVYVPSIKFRLKNTGPKPVRILYFNAEFKFADEEKALGYDYRAYPQAKPIKPREKSPEIFLRSPYGFRAKSKESFKNNPYWKKAEVRIIVGIPGGKLVDLGTYPIENVLEEGLEKSPGK